MIASAVRRVVAAPIAATVVASAIPFALVRLFPGRLHTVLAPGPYLAFHNTAEFFSIMVSLSVFGVGWYAYEQSRDRHALFLATVFLAVGLLDFMHTLGNAAMPAFLTPNSTNKSTQFWVLARLVNAAGLLASAFVRPDSPRITAPRRWLLAGAVAPCGVAFVAITFFSERLPATFVPGRGLTPLKVGAEWAVIAMLAAAALAYAWRLHPGAQVRYVAACVVGIFGEAAFASYRSGFDSYNVLGHLYKLVSFYLIYQAAFAASVVRPYVQLSGANARLRREVAEREQAEAQVRALNAELEQRVLERTAGLEAAHGALRDASRRKDEFLNVLSHELRNPLAPILTAVHLLDRAGPGSEQAVRARTVIRRQAEHLARLVDDLLDVTRIARGKIVLRRARVDLVEVVRRAVEDFRAVVEGRGLALRVALPGAPLWCDADPTRITQVLGNLLHNAAKFTPGGGAVTVSLRSAGDHAELRVRDSGTGFDPALLPHAFEPFVQGARADASEGGLGLGLALVKGIAELHGGTAGAANPGDGPGAELSVRLPLAAAPAAGAAAGPAGGVGARDGGRRVLVVDDNADAADTLSELLQTMGHTVEVAYDGPSAVARARAAPPDVVLCDLGLPGMSGYEVARALRGTDGLRMFAVSGYAQPEDVRRAVEAGFDGHLPKPCDLAAIQRLLAEA